MNRLFAVCLSFILITSTNGQQALHSLGEVVQNGTWVMLEADLNMSPDSYLHSYKKDFGLDELDQFAQLDHEHDRLGQDHYRYNQTHRDIPVEGAQYIVHAENDKVIRSNGKLVSGIYANNTPLIDAATALDAAILYMDAERFYWEDPHKEALIKRLKRDETATFYPKPELVYADRNYSQDGDNYRLAWKMALFAEGPKGHKTIFVDAKDGHILYALEECHDAGVEGIAETRYHGTQHFMTDSVAPGHYRLHDYSRPASIETYDMRRLSQTLVPDSAVDFTDDDNYWDHHNTLADDAATDVHWGMQETYDYFANKHGRISYDGDSSAIVSYVHVRNNWFNARWTGMWAEFGDGNGNPLTSIDVVSHELTHGVTRTSSGLVYRNESGALNESFSDIFGVAVEWQSYPDSADWYMGVLDFQFRSIKDPKEMGDPDTYLGVNWWTDEGDNGGVHTNSGVQNYWYYLLSMGGSGTNDNGDTYNLTGIGMEKAEAIAFRNLTTYLTVSSTYIDARYGAILSAEDLYGPCSEEVMQTIHAWYAVGVGPDMVIEDFEVEAPMSPIQQSCAFSDKEMVSMNILFRRSGCQNGLPAGSRIPLGYTLNGATVYDTLVLDSDIVDGDNITYTFPASINLSEPDFYDFEFFIDIPEDDNNQNDNYDDYTVLSIKTQDTSSLVNFNWFNRPPVPIYYRVENENSYADVARAAAATGLRGFLLTGKDVNQDNIDPATNEDENFTKNLSYESRMCYCVDASDFDSLSVAFDLRQGFAGAYAEIFGDTFDITPALAMRLIADEVPVSQQFHPSPIVNDTIDTDTFVHHAINLDQLAGTSFDLCFQGKHFFDDHDDFAGEGDYTHIDNVEFIMKKTVSGRTETEFTEDNINAFPNPSVDQFTLTWAEGLDKVEEIQILNITGQPVLRLKDIVGQSIDIDASNFTAGVYFVQFDLGDRQAIKRIIIGE